MKSLTTRRRTRRTLILTALAAVAATVAGVLVVGAGYDTSQVRMHSGAIWLASTQAGQATLVDGATAEVTARLPVAPPGSSLSLTQHGSAAHVLNRATGELRRIDSATEQISPPVTVLPAGDGLTVAPAPHVLYEVDVHSGTVASVDPDTLAPRGDPKPLAARITPDGPVVDGRGHLWAIDDETGDLVWLSGDERRTRSAATRSGARLAITRDQPALVDPERGTAELIDPGTGAVTRSARADLQAGDAVVVSGSADRSRLVVASGTRGTVIVCAFDTSSCSAPVTVSSPGSDLGTPVEVQNRAVVPDYSTGQATIVDLATSRVIAQHQLFDHPTRFELLARDGIVFFNDPNSNRAGVLDLAGDVRSITKYTDEHSEGDATPTPDHRTQADQVSKVDNKKQKPGLGIPGQIIQPTRTEPAPTPTPPAPTPTAAIVVEPGNRGVVGDEFELTLVLQPSTGTATTRWSFGDGTEATGATVTHRWQQPGTFTVRATATGDTGAQVSSAETAVTVEPPATPPRITQLTVRRPKPVIGETVYFGAESSGNPDKWAWRVTQPGENTPEVTAQTPEFEHAFTTPGTYTVTLTVTAGALTATSSRQLTVARGAVKAWGDNTYGQLNVPAAATSGVVAISSGLDHTLALKSDGSVVAFGGNSYRQRNVPASATSGVIAVAAGAFHSLALKKDGSVIGWGTNFYGTLDIPPAAKSGVVAIAAGYHHNLALKLDGSVIGWGSDEYDEISIPAAAKSGVTAISAKNEHSLALKSDGSVVAWGYDGDGEASVPPVAKSGVLAVAGGISCSLALKSDGSVIGWGSDIWQQLSIPPAAKSGVTAFAFGQTHGLALKVDGTVVGWGGDYRPIPPEFNSGVLAVAAGEQFSAVLV
ncbi:PKD domain-containing protein [Lentzea tibetensis]|uniref:PKD domain-containing protein n=1 Tax=Lentzea tibetensis TaxID=2591470 RepID=A0A563EXW8_9PSEU|nr:PKD domain-containing protein [Lentzea tibetensis]TWP52509.1 PKD domain-containing protein [Lentzea tibetensis]